jgi:ribonuclease HIII
MDQTSLFPPAAGRIGTDESGKGDYFGPLVVAGFFCPDGQEDVLRELGVKDSKRLSDNRVRDIAETLKPAYRHAVVAIGPERYNALYRGFRNLNKMLAWGHARAIENILDQVDVRKVVTDQFGDERFVKEALLKKGKTVELSQRPRAEEDVAVAAASILARAEFLKRLYFLGQDWGVELPKGASALVETAAVEIVRRHGREALEQVAKVHFKITGRVLAAV